jgi:hypothetical protein
LSAVSGSSSRSSTSGESLRATAAEVGPGFTARVIAGARERMESRRRQRFVGFGLVAVAAAGAAALMISSGRDHGRTPAPREVVRPAGGNLGIEAPDPGPGDEGITDDELRELVEGNRLSRAFEPTADWDDIEAPVSNYRAVLRLGGEP